MRKGGKILKSFHTSKKRNREKEGFLKVKKINILHCHAEQSKKGEILFGAFLKNAAYWYVAKFLIRNAFDWISCALRVLVYHAFSWNCEHIMNGLWNNFKELANLVQILFIYKICVKKMTKNINFRLFQALQVHS